MKHSTDRILTTHVGSLPRPEDMLEALTAKMRGQLVDEQALDARLPRAVADIVRQQVDRGLDVIDEARWANRASSCTRMSVVRVRTARCAGKRDRESASLLAGSREFLAFPEYYQPETAASRGTEVSGRANPYAPDRLPIRDTNNCSATSRTSRRL